MCLKRSHFLRIVRYGGGEQCNHHSAHIRNFTTKGLDIFMPNLMNYLNGKNIQQICLITKKGIKNYSLSVNINNLPLIACRFRHYLLYLKRIIFVRED
jgi:hypothetical protein